ncbi:MAG: beta-lactamase family protein [Colwellia sp.]|nr:beta-lactamase family protein [Colwellia sp.]
MKIKYIKRTVFAAVLMGSTVFGYLLYEPEIYSLDWQPLPKIEVTKGQSQQFEPGFEQEIVKAQHIIQQGLSDLGSPGISIAVGIKGKKVWAAGYGLADVENKKPITLGSQFRIGSTSKAVTSLAFGKLLEQNLLQLDDNIEVYLPGLPKALHGITIRQLASHQSGIRNYGTCFCLPMAEYYNNDTYTSVSDALAVFINDELQFQPGSQFSYSSYNYTLLSAVMEKAAKQPFLDLMNRQVFKPLKMNMTAADATGVNIPNQVKFYNVGQGHYQLSYDVDNSNKWAGGGFLSTPSDLVQMTNQLFSGKYLQKSTLATLFEPQKLNNGDVNKQNYALGWRHSITKKPFAGKSNLHYIHHGGTAAGSSSLLIMFPEYELVVSVLINSSIANYGELWDLTHKVATPFLSVLERKKSVQVIAL